MASGQELSSHLPDISQLFTSHWSFMGLSLLHLIDWMMVADDYPLCINIANDNKNSQYSSHLFSMHYGPIL